jgi:hypothetical protein
MRVSAQRGQYVISRQAPGDRFALVFTGDPRHPRGPYPHAMSLSRAESPGARSGREKPPQIPAIPTRYPRTPRSSPPSAVRRKRETPQQPVSSASGGPLRVRPCRVMAGWNYSRGRSAGSSGGLSIVLLLVMAAHNPKARSSALADATRRAALEAPSRRAWPRRPAHTLPTHRGTASLRALGLTPPRREGGGIIPRKRLSQSALAAGGEAPLPHPAER